MFLLSSSLISTLVSFGDSSMVSDSHSGLTRVRWAKNVSLSSVMLSLRMETFTVCSVIFPLKSNSVQNCS